MLFRASAAIGPALLYFPKGACGVGARGARGVFAGPYAPYDAACGERCRYCAYDGDGYLLPIHAGVFLRHKDTKIVGCMHAVRYPSYMAVFDMGVWTIQAGICASRYDCCEAGLVEFAFFCEICLDVGKFCIFAKNIKPLNR